MFAIMTKYKKTKRQKWMETGRQNTKIQKDNNIMIAQRGD